ncbi:MAG TPA: hypothetical protein VGN90_12025 [Pyrinomonadaceae bacterium]|jgi:hypothetical protein|nr:hypothetical protein [Pyrinomonadaceae bacterium]
MANEAGDAKLIGNFSKLIELVSANPDYNPANTKLKVPALTAQKTAAQAAAGEVGAKEAPYKAAVNDRQDAFEVVAPTMTRSGNMLEASGAGQKIRDDAKAVRGKIAGRRKTPKAKDDPDTPSDQATKSHSTSQLSYENIIGNVDDYIAILATVTTYAPNEAELTVAGLTALSNSLKAKGEAVNTTFVPLSTARGRRDQLLYLNEDCVVNIALLVKAYVRAAFGPDSQLFKSIKGLAFERQGKKG